MTHSDTGNTTRTDDASAAELQKQHPTWWVWVSDTRAWWASRRTQLTSADLAAGFTPYLRASNATDLAELLADQDENGRHA